MGVPLARRNLFQDRRRALLAVSGVAVAMLLVLVLNGLFAGAIRQVTAYLRNVPADVFVSQRGVRTMHMSASALPESTVEDVREAPGVAWAEAIRFTTTTMRSVEGRQLSYVIGYHTSTGRGGPWVMQEGRAPRRGEVVIDVVAADGLGVDIGSQVEVLGRSFRVSGLSSGGTSITNTIAYIRTQDFATLRGDAVSYILAGAEPGVDADELARNVRHELPRTTVQTTDEFVDQEANVVKDMSADIMQIMSIVAFLIGLAVITLTLFTATVSKLREYAVVKALGATSMRLTGTVVLQATWSTGLALVLATTLALGMAAIVASVSPSIRLAIEVGDVARVAVAAFAAGLLGTLPPLRRLSRVDPATAFRT